METFYVIKSLCYETNLSWQFVKFRNCFGSEWPLVIRGDTGQDDLCRPWESMARWHVIKRLNEMASVILIWNSAIAFVVQ
ncbi:hypothetical protein LguiB_004019 [Lonicera macranthoides]